MTTTLTLSISRLTKVFLDWNRLFFEDPNVNGLYFNNNPNISNAVNTIVIVAGTEINQINQRAAGLAHYLLAGSGKKAPENVVILLKRHNIADPANVSSGIGKNDQASNQPSPSESDYLRNCSVTICVDGSKTNLLTSSPIISESETTSDNSIPKINIITKSIEEGVAAISSEFEDQLSKSIADEDKINRYVGYAQKEMALQQGPFAAAFIDIIQKSITSPATADGDSNKALVAVNSTAVFGALLYCKDDEGIKNVRKAAAIGLAVIRAYVKPAITQAAETIVRKYYCGTDTEGKGERGKSGSGSSSSSSIIRSYSSDALSQKCKEFLEHPDTLKGYEKIQDATDFTVSLTPHILNGAIAVTSPDGERGGGRCVVSPIGPGFYDASVANSSLNAADKPLLGPEGPPVGVIVARHGSKFREQCAYTARTFFVGEESLKPRQLTAHYGYALEIAEKAAAELVSAAAAGAPLLEVYNNVMAFASAKDPALASHLMPQFGFLAGPVILENRATIGEKAAVKVRPGMTFVVRVVLQGLPMGRGSGPIAKKGGEAAAEVKSEVAKEVRPQVLPLT